jgi:hypothetical protein
MMCSFRARHEKTRRLLNARIGTNSQDLGSLLEGMIGYRLSSSPICVVSLLFRSGRRVCALSGGLRRRIGRRLLTAGAGPHDQTDDNNRRNNSRSDKARVPVRTIDTPVSGLIGYRP